VAKHTKMTQMEHANFGLCRALIARFKMYDIDWSEYQGKPEELDWEKCSDGFLKSKVKS
jgi:hypothetical protein